MSATNVTPIRHYRIGILVPSSNTKLEPAIESILQRTNTDNDKSIKITAHFTRIRVTQISLEASSIAQFDVDNFLQAASLLVDAGVHAIAWVGTSAGWLGIQNDRDLCSAITEHFGIPALTSTLALLDYMEFYTDKNLLLITPFVQEVNDAIRDNFAREGINVVDDQCLSIMDNREIGRVTDQQIEEMVLDVTARNRGVQTVAVFCTNLFTAEHAVEWGMDERYTVVDSIVITMWGLLRSIEIGENEDFGSDLERAMVEKYVSRRMSEEMRQKGGHCTGPT